LNAFKKLERFLSQYGINIDVFVDYIIDFILREAPYTLSEVLAKQYIDSKYNCNLKKTAIIDFIDEERKIAVEVKRIRRSVNKITDYYIYRTISGEATPSMQEKQVEEIWKLLHNGYVVYLVFVDSKFEIKAIDLREYIDFIEDYMEEKRKRERKEKQKMKEIVKKVIKI